MKSLRSHYSLVPLFVCVGGGAVFAAFYILRLTQNADSTWNRSKNPFPWQKIKHNEQTKFYAGKTDYKNLDNPRPDYQIILPIYSYYQDGRQISLKNEIISVAAVTQEDSMCYFPCVVLNNRTQLNTKFLKVDVNELCFLFLLRNMPYIGQFYP